MPKPLLGSLLVLLTLDLVQGEEASAGRVLLVDKRGGASYVSLRAAAQAAQPGDTIKLVPGSGPYREPLFIKVSGEPGRPITVDGSGETVTGFEPLTGFQRVGESWVLDLKPFFARLTHLQGFVKKDGKWLCNNPRVTLPVFPGVLIYQGERLRQDSQTGQFTKYATFSPADETLTLLPGTKPEGWEVSSRDPVIQINNVSHHVYRNLRATGSLNDGINLHGTGEDLLFENVEACQNIDEGFSAHDDIHCEIRHGRFWGNDNGIANAPKCEMKGTDVQSYDNLGWGLSFGAETKTELVDTQAWGNGVTQLIIQAGAQMTLHNVKLYDSAWKQKPWLNYQESSSRTSGETYLNETKLPPGGEPVEIVSASKAPDIGKP